MGFHRQVAYTPNSVTADYYSLRQFASIIKPLAGKMSRADLARYYATCRDVRIKQSNEPSASAVYVCCVMEVVPFFFFLITFDLKRYLWENEDHFP